MRLRTSLLILALTTLTAPAFAQNEVCGRLPPMRYIHEPTQPYTVLRADEELLREKCNPGIWALAPTPLACAVIETNEIVIRNYLHGGERMLRCILVHEKAHLNGWPGDHPIR